MSILMEEVESLTIEGVDSSDYPDFCDAYFGSGYHKRLERDLTDDELYKLAEDYPEVVNEMAFESLI